MKHINIKTGNLDFPYIEKIYITNDKLSYISLNSGRVVYFENNLKKYYQFDMGKGPFKMLTYLMENNSSFVSSDLLYEDIYGEIEYENHDAKVDGVRNTLCRIPCIKNSDIKIKKHSGGETTLPGFSLVLPEQPLENNIDDEKNKTANELKNNEYIIKESQIKEHLARKAEDFQESEKNLTGELPYEVEMYFTDDKGKIKDYHSLRKMLFSAKDNFVIGGEAGVGKSFLLKKLFCENGNKNTPALIYVKLNDINTCTKKENYSVIQSLLILYYGKKFWDNLVDLVENINDETAKPVLLLDGLNEIGYVDREALFGNPFLHNFKIILSTRSEDGIPEKYVFHRIRINNVSETEFESILRQNGITEDYTDVPRTPLFIKLILTTAKLEQPFGRLLRNDGTVEGILQNYVLCELEKTLSSFKMNGRVKKVDVALSVYAIIPYLAYRMTAGNIYSVSNEQIQKILEEVLVPEKGAVFSTPEDVEKYSLSRKLLSGIYSESNLIKQLNISDIGEELVSNKLLYEISNNLIKDKNILLLKNSVDDTEQNVSYSFFHQTIQEYLAQLFLYEVISTEIILEDILFDGPVKANNFSYIFNMYSREQILSLHRMIQCNEKYLDYRIGILRSIWNREVMGESFSYANLDLSNTKEFIVKNDLLEGIDIFNNANIGPNNYDFNSLFGREDGRATGILYVSQSKNGIKTLSDDGIIRTWRVSSEGIACIHSKRTVFYLKNRTSYMDVYPRNLIERIEEGYDVESQLLERVSKSKIIQGDYFNLVIDNDLLFMFDGYELKEIPDFCKCSEVVRGFLKNKKLCIQNEDGDVILWDKVYRYTVLGWSEKEPREIFRFSVENEKLVAFSSLLNNNCFLVMQNGLGLKVYMYENNYIRTEELPNVLKTTDVIVNDFFVDCGAFYCVCLCCENGSLICVFIDIFYQVEDARRFDDIHDCKLTSFFLDAYNYEESNYIFLCSCDLNGIINISRIIENKQGLLCVNSRELFDFEGSIKKQIIPFWQYYEGFEKVNNASGEIVFINDSKALPNDPAPREITANKWHIFNGYLYKYTRDMESEYVPSNVKTIGKYAFANSKIKYLLLSDSVEIIEEYAFEKSDITSISFPQSISSIGDYAFSYCKYLEDVIFSGESIRLGIECFSNSGIRSVLFENGNVSIGEKCFSRCLKLEQLLFNNCIEEIGDSAFSDCKKLHSIEWGNRIEKIGSCAFAGCEDLVTIQLPESIQYIGRRAFAFCDQLKEAILMGNYRELSLSIFEDCIQLETIVISNKTKTITDVLDEKTLYFDDQIAFLPVNILTYDRSVRIMNKSFFDNEVMEQRLYCEICKKDSFDEFKNQIQKKMPISDKTFLTVYYHNHIWAEHMLEKGFDVTVLVQVFYNSICEANNKLIEILLNKIDDIYFIEQYDCFSIYNAFERMLDKDCDNIKIVGLLIKKGLIISDSIVEMVLAKGSKKVLEFFLKYLFGINYFDGIQNFIDKIEYLIEINDVIKKAESTITKYVSYLSVHQFISIDPYEDPDVLAYQKFLSENIDLRDRIGIRNWDNIPVLTAIKESYMKYYKML